MAGAFISTAVRASAIHGAINDVGPMNQISYGFGIEAETLLGNGGDEAGAGFEVGVVELAVALILLEVGRVGGRQKRAFMMVEPPGDFGRAGILEIHDGIFVAIKVVLIEQGSRRGAAGRRKQTQRRCEFVHGKNARKALRMTPRQSTCRDKTPELSTLSPLPARIRQTTRK